MAGIAAGAGSDSPTAPGGPRRAITQRLPAMSSASSGAQRVVLYDRRANLRLDLHVGGRLQWDDQSRNCRVTSLGAQGMRCLLPVDGSTVPPPLGASARVTTIVDGALLAIDATVAWIRSDGQECRVGLRFDDLDEARRDQLLTFLQSATEGRSGTSRQPQVSPAS